MLRTVAAVLEHRGCRLSYEIAGEGPPVLWIQGVGAHGSCWRPQIEGLADRFACLSYDNRGIGKSFPKGTPITVPQLAEDAARLIEAAGWESAHVVGHSMGGMVALQLALDYPKRVRSLFLSCTFARGQQVAPPTMRMIWVGLRTRIGTRVMRRNAFLELIFPRGFPRRRERAVMAAKFAEYFGHDLADTPSIVPAQLQALRECDLADRLGELAGIPTAVNAAAHDLLAPARLGRALAAGIPGAEFVEYSDAAHGLPLQFPARFNERVAHYLEAAEARRGTAD